MALYFETAVSYDKMMENGAVKKVTEKNLFDALSFSESEARTIEQLTPYISGEFTVKAAKRTKISEIFFDASAEKYWLVCVAFITFDEKTGAEKESVTQILVQANDFDSAVALFKERMKETVSDWAIKSVAETPYMNVYPAIPTSHEESEEN